MKDDKKKDPLHDLFEMADIKREEDRQLERYKKEQEKYTTWIVVFVIIITLLTMLSLSDGSDRGSHGEGEGHRIPIYG